MAKDTPKLYCALNDIIAMKDQFDGFRDDFLSEDPKAYGEKLKALAGQIQHFCVLDSDLLLAFFHLNRKDSYDLIKPLFCAVLCELLGKTNQMPEVARFGAVGAALSHDIGMYTLRATLATQMTPLTEEQRADLKLHPIRSVKLLRNAGVDNPVWLESVAQHHERLDGSGYPHGLDISDISMGARLIAIADIYTAMIKPHAHRKGTLAKEALSELFISRGDKIDNELTQLFIRELGLFPPGGCVRLMNGDIAVVSHRGKDSTRPVVQSIIGPRGAPLDKPVPRNTSHGAFAVREMLPEDEFRDVVLSFANDLWSHKKLHFKSTG